MDYAKYSYVKLSELNSQTKSKTQKSASTIEFSSGILNMQITDISHYTFGELYVYGNTYLQVSAILSSLVQGKVLLELLVDEIAVLQEERTIDGETQVILIKSITPNISKQSKIQLKIKVKSESFACTLTNCVLVAWGSVSDVKNTGLCMRALCYDNRVLVSYNQNNTIWVCDSNITEKTFSQDDFLSIGSGISHCFATDKHSLYFFRVDASGNLFYSKYQNILNETKIDDGVSDVFARQCNSSYNEDMLICYIKNHKVYYCTMQNGTISYPVPLTLPDGEYVGVEIVDSPQAENMFILCLHKNKSIYILHSVDENSITTFTDTFNGSIMCLCKKYVNFEGATTENSIVETLKAGLSFGSKSLLLNYQDYLGNKIMDKFSANISPSTQLYQIELEPEYNYEISYNQLQTFQNGAYRIVYGGDCKDWQRATMDVQGTGTISDPGGLLQKWPFNKIKPCLIDGGKFIGYLDPNDYSKFEDGTDADITNPKYDVMVEFPKMYYKIEEEWDGECGWNKSQLANIKISLTNVYKEGYVCHSHTKGGIEYNKIYISAYENFVPESQQNSQTPNIQCCSGLPSHNIKTHQWVLENLESMRGSQYSTFHVHIMTMLQILSMFLFQEYEGLYTYGQGYYGSKDNLFNTGCANTVGMFYGLKQQGEHFNKLFGLENILGHSYVILDGLLTKDMYNYLIYDPTNPKCKLDYSGTNFNQYYINKHSFNDFLCRVTASNDFGFLASSHVPVESYGSRYYYCRNKIRASTEYSGNFNTSTNSNPENMIYNFGGGYADNITSLFTYLPMFNKTDTDANAERLVCYPDQEKS